MKTDTLKDRLNILAQRIKHFLKTAKPKPGQEIESFRARLKAVQAKVQKLPPERQAALFHLLWKDLDEVVFCFEQVASRLNYGECTEEQVKFYAKLDDQLAGEMQALYVQRFG
jgi:hypothetical protein